MFVRVKKIKGKPYAYLVENGIDQTLRKFDQKELLVRVRENNNKCFANANMESSFSDLFTKSLNEANLCS